MSMSLQEFQELNETKGFFWFKPDTMGFFKSRIETWDPDTGYFITRETNPSKITAYTIRRADFETGNVSTIGEFHAHKTLLKAKQALQKLL